MSEISGPVLRASNFSGFQIPFGCKTGTSFLRSRVVVSKFTFKFKLQEGNFKTYRSRRQECQMLGSITQRPGSGASHEESFV